jgi:hypothetical protein
LERPRIIDSRDRVSVVLHPFTLPDHVRSVKGIPIYFYIGMAQGDAD